MSDTVRRTRVAKVLCLALGHKWREAWNGGPKAKGAPILFCLRCKENGWWVARG